MALDVVKTAAEVIIILFVLKMLALRYAGTPMGGALAFLVH